MASIDISAGMGADTTGQTERYETPQARRRVWGWYAFDWASQPYNTLLLTFIFGPYINDILGDGSVAQAAWGYGIGAAGIAIAILAPILGTIADRGVGRMGFIRVFSLLYVLGAMSTWLARPEDPSLVLVLALFALGLIGMECATLFINAMLPSLGRREDLGRISGTGWAIGYVGGLSALVLVLLFLAESRAGVTLLGTPPPFGLDPEAREGTRLVGPLSALWFAVFMVPFFLWVREPMPRAGISWQGAARRAWPDLRARLAHLPRTPSLFSFLAASMFYRDALNGVYVIGGIYAAGVLGWSVVETGIFGIIALIAAAAAAFLGGRADSAFGPKPVIVTCVTVLTLAAAVIAFVQRDSVLGIAVPPDSRAPDVAFYIVGAVVGAAGGTLQAASRTMMCHQASPAEITQAFGLYAFAGKATSFLAPLSIAVVTDVTGSQQAGIVPLIVLFLLGLVLLAWVKPDGGGAL